MNQVMEQAVLQAAQQLEDQVDQQIHTMENMSEDDVGKLRRERLAVRQSHVALFSARQSCDLQGNSKHSGTSLQRLR